MIKTRLVHMHVPKTCGSTIYKLLSSLYDIREICPERTRDINKWSTEDLAVYKFFSAHAHLADFDFVPDAKRYITFLRDPIDRCISLFQYYCSFTDSAIEARSLTAPRLAKRLGLERFYSYSEQRRTGEYVNVYAKSLIVANAEDQIFVERSRPSAIAERAIEKLNEVAFVGICEHMDESVERMYRSLQMENKFDGLVVNSTRINQVSNSDVFTNTSIGKIEYNTLSMIAELNEADKLIYDYALKMFNPKRSRSFRCVPVGPITSFDGSGNCWVKAAHSGFAMIGPYTRIQPGSYTVRFKFRSESEICAVANGFVDICAESGAVVLTSKSFSVSPLKGSEDVVDLSFCTDTMVNDVEFRCFFEEAVDVCVSLIVDTV